MDDDDLARERLQSLSDAELSALYDATPEIWQIDGLSKEAFLGNFAAKRDYDSVVRPLALAYEAAVAMSEREEVRSAKRTYDEFLEANERNPNGTPVSPEALEAKRAYDAAIEQAGDDRVIAAKAAFEAAVIEETPKFGDRLR